MAHKRILVLCPAPYIQPSQQALLVCSGDPVFVSEIILNHQIFWPFVTQGWRKMMTAADEIFRMPSGELLSAITVVISLFFYSFFKCSDKSIILQRIIIIYRNVSQW